MSLSEAYDKGKIAGCEKIPFKLLAAPMKLICQNTKIISGDSNLIIFRFFRQNYRILCRADHQHANLLYIVAFDFDFTAYDHG